MRSARGGDRCERCSRGIILDLTLDQSTLAVSGLDLLVIYGFMVRISSFGWNIGSFKTEAGGCNRTKLFGAELLYSGFGHAVEWTLPPGRISSPDDDQRGADGVKEVRVDESRDYECQEIRENAYNRHDQQLILFLIVSTMPTRVMTTATSTIGFICRARNNDAIYNSPPKEELWHWAGYTAT